VVGFCIFGACRDPAAPAELGEIRAINLHPDHWRRGLGAELLAASCDALRAQGCSAAVLWVLGANERARCFYAAQGWHADGGTKRDAPPGCPPLEHVRYRLELTAREA
jgi:GNAT superfamily N-acetyltransferase